MEWLENEGMSQVRRNARRSLKNYKIAKEIKDKENKIVEEDNNPTYIDKFPDNLFNSLSKIYLGEKKNEYN